jgi:hypothetical protein
MPGDPKFVERLTDINDRNIQARSTVVSAIVTVASALQLADV